METGETENGGKARESREPSPGSGVEEGVRHHRRRASARPSSSASFRGVYAARAETRPAGTDAASRREEARTLLVEVLVEHILARRSAAAERKEAA
jgi:hypothetical protein